MTTTLAIIGLLFIIGTLYLLSDTITQVLSDGKSFLPAEMKNSSTPPTFLLLKAYSLRKPALVNKVVLCAPTKRVNNKKLLVVLIDTASVIIFFYIIAKIGAFILRHINI